MYSNLTKFQKNFVKGLAAGLSVLMLLSGCGNAKQGAAVNTDKNAAAANDTGKQMKGNMYLSGVPIVKDKEKFTMLITYSGNNVDPKDMGVHKKLEEKTNIAMTYDFVLPAGAKERKATMFAGGEYTDVIGGDILSDADVVTYGTQGALIPLEDLIKQYMPKFNKILTDKPSIKKDITAPDGHIYALPVINYRSSWPDPDHYAVPTWNINKIWLQKLNLKIPKNTDELLNVLRAFKTKDPNGNGKQDEIPMTLMYSTANRTVTTCLYPAFGVVDYTNHIDVINGKVVYTATLPQYKEAIKYMAQLYKEGLIDAECFTMDSAKYNAKVAQKDPTIVGIFSAFGGYSEAGSDRILEEFDDILPLEGPGGKKLWGRQNNGVTRNKLAITSACKKPEVIARWADELFDSELSVELEYGMLGKQTEKQPDGKYKQIDPPNGGNIEEWLRADTTRVLPHAVLVAENILIGKDATTKYNKSLKYKDYVDPEIYPLVFMNTDETNETTRLDTSINALTNQKTAEWITGKSDVEADWNSFQNQLKQLGLEKMLQIRQQAMDRYNK